MSGIPYASQWLDDADIAQVTEALRSACLTQGPLVAEFEKKVARYCGAKFAVALNSGTSALHAAVFAAGIKSGDEVITSPITFVATSNSVLYCGGIPVFADVQSDTINLDPLQVRKKITPKTKAIIPVHFAGHPCDLQELSEIAQEHKLVVIEDAAHALGAEYKGSKIGAGKYLDLTILSFHAVKHITTGEGGMVLTNREDLYKKMVTFRTHGITREVGNDPWYYEMQSLGYNYRITDFQCALGSSQLDKLDRFVARRREIVERYQSAFGKMDGITTLAEKHGCKSAWHIYPVMVKGARREIFDRLRKSGIGVNVHYIPVYRQPYYRERGYAQDECPQAEAYYESAITLPLFPKMSNDDVETVIDRVKESLHAR